MSSTSELFINAQHAMWAGDYKLCLDLLAEAAASDDVDSDKRRLDHAENTSPDSRSSRPPTATPDDDGVATYSDPVALMRWRAATLAKSLKEAEPQPPPKEYIIQTRHLRGVFHQISARRFEFRAFLRDWKWQRELFRRTRILAEKHHRKAARRASTRDAEKAETRVKLYNDPSSTWTTVEQQMLLEVTISDFALVLVTGTWIAPAEPSAPEPVSSAFRRVLETIESTETDAA